jgi:hypothetical protein
LAKGIIHGQHGGDNQRFRVEPHGGHFKITAKHSGLVLDVEGGHAKDGDHVVQYGWHGGNNQLWKIVDLGGVPPHVNHPQPVAHQGPLAWKQLEGLLERVSASGRNVWGVNKAHGIYQYDFNANHWVQRPGSAVDIAAASDGTAWCVNGNDNVFRWDGHTWHQLPGLLRRISAASNNNVWGTNKAHEIYYWDGSNWHKSDGEAQEISVGEDGTVFALNNAHDQAGNFNIYRKHGHNGAWQNVQGGLISISVYDGNTVIGCNKSGEIFTLHGDNWRKEPGIAYHCSAGGPNHTHHWCINSHGHIFIHGHPQ